MKKFDKYVVFLDRDGTINIDKDYVHKIEDFEFINNSDCAIRRLNELNIKIVIVTNQSGIDRGFYNTKDVEILHDYMLNKLAEINATIDAIYYCPYLNSEFRKPNSGMFTKSIEDLNLSDYKKYVIGDKISDILAGEKVGCEKILVLTGKGEDSLIEAKSQNIKIDYIAKDLLDAVEYIETSIKI